jgi:Fe2+ or Zn2+ uptake regulation protein
MSCVDDLCAQLKAQGRRVTPQRRAIIQTLLEDLPHSTAEQVYTCVRDSMPGMSRATVYNTLHELVGIGALQELDLGLGERTYDITTTSHAHLVCLRCGRVEDAFCALETPVLPPEQTHGFRVVDCNVVFRGYCPACDVQRQDDQDRAQ